MITYKQKAEKHLTVMKWKKNIKRNRAVNERKLKIKEATTPYNMLFFF